MNVHEGQGRGHAFARESVSQMLIAILEPRLQPVYLGWAICLDGNRRGTGYGERLRDRRDRLTLNAFVIAYYTLDS